MFCFVLLRISCSVIIAINLMGFLSVLLLLPIVTILWLQFPHLLVRRALAVVADLLEYCLQHQDRLFGDELQILEGVVLMLLEGLEQHVHDGLTTDCHRGDLLLALGVIALQLKAETQFDITDIHMV